MATTRRQWLRSAMAGLGSSPLAFAMLRSDASGHAAVRQATGTTAYPYLHVDVFTDRPLTGNQLAVFMEPQGLSDEQMQAIARELNFSEITFVFPPEDASTQYRVRIFTRNREMAFAGHPVIGTAFALAHAGLLTADSDNTVFGLGIGPTNVSLEWERGDLAFAWMTQPTPTFGPVVTDIEGLATGLGLDVEALRAPGLPFQEVSCGNPFFFVPLATRADVDRIVIRRDAMESVYRAADMPVRAFYPFSTEPGGDGATAYSRMLGVSGFEDPATGSAAGPLGCYLVHHGVVAPGEADGIVSAQGVAMKRPSRIHVRIAGTPEAITGVEVGGKSAFVGEGTVRTGD